MNRDELKKILDKRGIPKMFYSLNGLKDGICLCIVPDSGKWRLIDQERSSKNHIGNFDSESDVCNKFYQIMKNDYGWED